MSTEEKVASPAVEQVTEQTPLVEKTEAEKPAPEVKAEGEATTEAAPEKTAEEKAAEEAATKKKSNLDKRFATMTRDREEARREAEYWKKVAQEKGGAQPTTPAPVPTGKPTLAQYNGDVEKFAEAVADWKFQQQTLQTQRAAQIEKLQERSKAFAETHPDYEEVLASTNGLTVADEITEMAATSEHGPAIAYFLAQNPEEIERLNKMTPYRRVAELGKLEDKIAAQSKPATEEQKKEVKKAPAPITPVKGTVPSKEKSVFEMTAQELNAYYVRQDKEKRAGASGRK